MSPRKSEDDAARRVFLRMAEEKRPYHTEIRGIRIEVWPSVFFLPEECTFFVEHLPPIVGSRSFIEIGIGTGVVSIAAVRGGGTLIGATDNNPRAVLNARENCKAYRINADIRVSDGLKRLSKDTRADVIFYVHPFLYGNNELATLLEQSVSDYRYKGITSIMADARNHLNPGGEFLLETSNLARLNFIKGLARGSGYTWKLLKKEPVRFAHRPNETGIDLRIYSFKPKE